MWQWCGGVSGAGFGGCSGYGGSGCSGCGGAKRMWWLMGNVRWPSASRTVCGRFFFYETKRNILFMREMYSSKCGARRSIRKPLSAHSQALCLRPFPSVSFYLGQALGSTFDRRTGLAVCWFRRPLRKSADLKEVRRIRTERFDIMLHITNAETFVANRLEAAFLASC